ncbi:MAG: GNAT family N-acetyltransferase [Gammaproteobacteria bacterium]|nr:GNAT family N-acetyltransferase [Gammaproteobacteria bacterium]
MSQQLKASLHFNLQPVVVQHLESIASWYQNIDELALIESNLPLPVSALSLETMWQRDLEQIAPRTSYLYAICNEAGEAVGFTGLQEINLTSGYGVVFVFVEKNNRRHGLALRSTALMLDMAFEQLRLHRVTTYVDSENRPSGDLIRKIGFINEGCMREACFYNGDYHDVNVVGMLVEEWRALRVTLSEQLDSTTILSIGNYEDSKWIWPLK